MSEFATDLASNTTFSSIDPIASSRWLGNVPAASPWLHEEVGRRMLERLDIIKLPSQNCLNWQPAHGGLQAHAQLQQRCNNVQVWQPNDGQVRPPIAQSSINMVWANMTLHMAPNPRAAFEQWRQCLAPDGFVLFSVLGPSSFFELRDLYQSLGWQPPCHAFTDMHNWGDALQEAGFADVVMDAERITLTFATPQRLLQELRELGRNLSPHRSTTTRGKQWLQQWYNAVHTLVQPNGQIPLTFEIIYGHAIQGTQGRDETGGITVDLAHMRRMLLGNRH